MNQISTEAELLPVLSTEAPLHIVFNPRSGNHEGEDLQQIIERVLTAAGRPYRLFRIDDPRYLARAAREALEQARQSNGIVVAAGGDGTLNAVAQELLGQPVAFGVLPQGTFNYFGRVHGISQDSATALEALLRARPRPVQVARVNGRIVLVNASVGLYPTLLEDREAHTRLYGRSRWVALYSGLLTLLREHRQLRLQIHSETGTRRLRTPTLFVGNNALQLRRVGVAEADAVERNVGLLAGIVVRPISSWSMLWLLLRGALGTLGEDENVETFVFRRIVVNPLGHRRVKVAIDGEIVMLRSPVVFDVAPERLWLMVPAPEDRVEED